MTMIIHSNNLVSLDGSYVGRIDRDTFDTVFRKPNVKTTFFTAKNGDRTNLSVSHIIDEALYIGGPSVWAVNPAFEHAVRRVLAKLA